MLIGSTRQGVINASFSLYCGGNFSDDGGTNLLNSPSLFMMSWTPRFASTTSNPGLPARHSVSARSDTFVESPRQYSTGMPYFFSKALFNPSIACGTTEP